MTEQPCDNVLGASTSDGRSAKVLDEVQHSWPNPWLNAMLWLWVEFFNHKLTLMRHRECASALAVDIDLALTMLFFV
jgi:hypothetical protein